VSRIVAGSAGGRRLRTPGGRETRPTSDRVREALFSRLDHEGVVRGARVLDLYAGSGALGLEAASRGAAHVLLVDSAAAAVAVCRRNAADLGLREVAVRLGDVAAVLDGEPGEPYDLVLADPPYPLGEDGLALVLARLGERGWLAPGAVLVVERAARSPEPRWPAGVVRFDVRRYGETALWFADAEADPEPA
jgi:16S rRNA (guanine966-N2)-methyltransferase